MEEISKKLQEKRLRRHVHGHVMHYVGGRATEMEERKKMRGRPKSRWLDSVVDGIREKGLSTEEAYNREIIKHQTRLTSIPLIQRRATIESNPHTTRWNSENETITIRA